jgi:hypothetical protein
VWDLFFFIPAIIPLSCCSPHFSFIKFC